MGRQRIGVVLLVPQPLATEIEGLRRALGDGARERIAPHVTLIPPVNVNERDLSAVFGAVRTAAGTTHALRLVLGPVRTFAPVNPVAYLDVGGEPDEVEALRTLRAAMRTGTLDRPDQHEFTPHVTIADELAEDRLDAAKGVLSSFSAEVTFDRVHILAEQTGRRWLPVADAMLGARPGVVGRGTLPLEVSVSGRPDVEAAALLAIDGEPGGLPWAVTLRSEGEVVAAAWGWSAGDRLEVADLAVASAHRAQGIGRHLLAAVEDLAQRRSCMVAGLAAPTSGAPAALLAGSGWLVVGGSEPSSGRARWERRLPAQEAVESSDDGRVDPNGA